MYESVERLLFLCLDESRVTFQSVQTVELWRGVSSLVKLFKQSNEVDYDLVGPGDLCKVDLVVNHKQVGIAF